MCTNIHQEAYSWLAIARSCTQPKHPAIVRWIFSSIIYSYSGMLYSNDNRQTSATYSEWMFKIPKKQDKKNT